MSKSIAQLALDSRIVRTKSEATSLEQQMMLDHNRLTKFNPLNENGIASEINKDGYNIQLAPGHRNHADKIFIAQDRATVEAIVNSQQYASDDSIFSLPSSGTPPYFTQLWTNKVIEPLFKKTALRDMTTDWQMGTVGLTDVKIPTMNYTGSPKIYSDFGGHDSTTGINTNWVPRQVLYLEQTLNYGDMTVAQQAMAKIDYISRLRQSLMTSFQLVYNDIGFAGFDGMQIYGLLNDPNLNASIPVPNGVSGFASWDKKDFFEIINDVRLAMNELAVNLEGHWDVNVAMTMGVTPNSYVNLIQKINPLGTQTVLEFLTKTYPGLKIVQVQNYVGTAAGGENYLQVIMDEVDGQEVANNCFVTLYNSHGAVRLSSSTNEKVSMGLMGSIVCKPMGVATLTGM